MVGYGRNVVGQLILRPFTVTSQGAVLRIQIIELSENAKQFRMLSMANRTTPFEPDVWGRYTLTVEPRLNNPYLFLFNKMREDIWIK